MKISIENKEAKFLIRIADTSLILAQRLAEMCSNGPFLEEDIALSNTSLDAFGRAEEMYKIISKIEGEKYSPDDYVFRRNEREFFNIKLVEQPNDDFAWTIARQYMHDLYSKKVYTSLLKSSNTELSGLASKVLKEVEYSLIHSNDWMYRLGLGTTESNSRLQNAIDHLRKFVQEIFKFDDLDKEFLPDYQEIEDSWNKEFTNLLSEVNIEMKEIPQLSMRDYRDGFHSEHIGHLLSIMQYLPRAYPEAKW